tara:strand:+ start:324 stop:551 length:228 start_codon:yes stop_codon:yes gene_type:complete
MSSKKLKIASISVLLLGIIMFLIGIDTFTYLGNINPFYAKLGEICFIYWLPTLIIGAVMTILALKKGNKDWTNNI